MHGTVSQKRAPALALFLGALVLLCGAGCRMGPLTQEVSMRFTNVSGKDLDWVDWKWEGFKPPVGTLGMGVTAESGFVEWPYAKTATVVVTVTKTQTCTVTVDLAAINAKMLAKKCDVVVIAILACDQVDVAAYSGGVLQ